MSSLATSLQDAANYLYPVRRSLAACARGDGPAGHRSPHRRRLRRPPLSDRLRGARVGAHERARPASRRCAALRRAGTGGAAPPRPARPAARSSPGRRRRIRRRKWPRSPAPAALGTVAAGDELWSVFTLRLQRAMPRARWAEGGQLLRPLRMIKDEREIALLAEAARRTDESWEEFLTFSITGLTEWEVRDRLMALLSARGLTAGFLQRRQRSEWRVAAPDRRRPRDRTRRCGRLRLGRHPGGL